MLREVGFPVVFVQADKMEWVADLNGEVDSAIRVKGHIFLEVYVDSKWILLDARAGVVYLDYDYNNFSLPNKYYAFAKSLDGWETGCVSLSANNKIMTSLFHGFDVNKYQVPIYNKIKFN